MALSQKQVRELKPDPKKGKEGEYWEWERGLGVHVRRSGRKTFAVKFRVRDTGQQRVYTIGDADKVTLAHARKEARRILVAVEEGHDPVQERQDKRQRGLTVSDLAEKWLGTVELKPTTRKLYEHNLAKAILPKLGKRSASKLTPADVRKLYFAIKDGGHATKANRTLTTVGAMFGWAARRDLIPSNPAAGAVARPDRAKETEDKRYLSEGETSRFLAACEHLRSEGGHHGRVAVGFELMLFCGLRPTDVFDPKSDPKSKGRGLRWDVIDFDRGVIDFGEDQKAGDAPARLNGPARALLASLDRTDPVWVFPSHRRPGRALADVRSTWGKVRELAAFDDPQPAPKALRKTFASHGRAWGFLAEVKPLLRHSERGDVTTAHYAHADGTTIAQAAEAIGTKLAAFASPKAAVLEFKAAK